MSSGRGAFKVVRKKCWSIIDRLMIINKAFSCALIRINTVILFLSVKIY